MKPVVRKLHWSFGDSFPFAVTRADSFVSLAMLGDGRFAVNPFLRLGFFGFRHPCPHRMEIRALVFDIKKPCVEMMLKGHFLNAFVEMSALEEASVILHHADDEALRELQKRELESLQGDKDTQIWAERLLF